MRNKLDREHGESGDTYDRVVVRLNAKWRIVECRAHIQWILQRRKSASDGGGWSARSFCRTSEALRRVAAEHAGAIDPEAQEALDRLPEWIEDAPAVPAALVVMAIATIVIGLLGGEA